MNLTAILGLIAQLVPVAKNVIDALHGAATTPSPSDEVLDLIAKLSPVAADLLAKITDIRSQTVDQFPAVWAAVHNDYQGASAKFDELMAATKTT